MNIKTKELITVQNWIKDGPLVMDGAMGTELIDLGLQVTDCPHRWNIVLPAEQSAGWEVKESIKETGMDVKRTSPLQTIA